MFLDGLSTTPERGFADFRKGERNESGGKGGGMGAGTRKHEEMWSGRN